MIFRVKRGRKPRKTKFSYTVFYVEHEFHISFSPTYLVWRLDGLENRDFWVDG